MDAKHLLHRLIVGPTTANDERLRSRHLFVTAALKPLNELFKLSIRVAQCTDHKWDVKYCEGQSELRLFVPRPGSRTLSVGLPRLPWVRRNRLCTGVGRFQSSMLKWGLPKSGKNTKERKHRRKVALDFAPYLLLCLRCFVFSAVLRNFKTVPSSWSSRMAVPLPLLAWLYILIISLELVLLTLSKVETHRGDSIPSWTLHLSFFCVYAVLCFLPLFKILQLDLHPGTAGWLCRYLFWYAFT